MPEIIQVLFKSNNPNLVDKNLERKIYETRRKIENEAIKKSSGELIQILNEYVDYILVMEKKGYDLSRMLKHLFGLSKGDKNAKLFRKRVHEIMIEGNLQDNRNKLIELIN